MAIGGFAVLLCLGALILWFMYTYNRFAGKQKAIDNWWDEADTHLKLRHNLLPDLLDKAHKLLSEEDAKLEEIRKINEKISETSDINDENQEKLENHLSAALRSLQNFVREQPNAMMDENFLKLMGELVSIEGRATMACAQHNELVKDFNLSIHQFPANLVVRFLHFYPREMRIFGVWEESPIQ